MRNHGRLFRIDCGAESAARYGPGWVVVGVDVFRATTVLCTASAMGRRCFIASDPQEASALVASVPGALLAGEQAGRVPPGFDLGNSPAEIARRTDIDRPLALVTSSGTPLLRSCLAASVTYAACLRNVTAQLEHLLTLDQDVALIAAGTRGERRDEDDLACAWIGAGLRCAGYACDPATSRIVEHYQSMDVRICEQGPSAAFLRGAGHQNDIDFVLSHVDDLDAIAEVSHQEVLHATCEIRCA